MKFSIAKGSIKSVKTDVVAIGCHEQPSQKKGGSKPAQLKMADGGIELDRALSGAISDQIKTENFSGKRGESRLLFTAGRVPAKFVLLIGLGPKEKMGLDRFREAGVQMARETSKAKATSLALILERANLGDLPPRLRARAIAEGIVLGSYRFTRYKTNDNAWPETFASTTFIYDNVAAPVESAIEAGRIVAEATCMARDMVNTPALDMTPTTLATRAQQITAQENLTCTVWKHEEIKKANMNCLLAVSKGSAEPPTFIRLSYKPKKKARAHIALVGKGITFDAGGLSLKDGRSMELMKNDMAGAAAVLAAMDAIAKLKPSTAVTAYIPATENLPDGRAIRPGDIITAKNGKTIEIVNTDAEGRLILADALSLAADQKPNAIIDVATLTGGALYCCGELYTIAIGNNQRIVDSLIKSAKTAGEYMWQLPIVEEYKKGYTSGIADLNNTGKTKASTISGAIFLREFVGDVPWAHLDIAGASWTDEEIATCPKGATGVMVRTLVDFVIGF